MIRGLVAAATVLAACGKAPARPVEVEAEVEVEAKVVVEVAAPPATFLGKDISKRIGPTELAAVEAHRDVVAVFPRMALRAPARGWAERGGKRVEIWLEGTTDGIPPGVVAGDAALRDRFVEVNPAVGTVPVLVSPDAMPASHIRIAKVLGRRLTITIEVGSRKVPAQIVGVSRHAAHRGLSLPLGVVEAWNREALGADGVHYSSMVVTLRDVGRLDRFETWLRDELELEVRRVVVPTGGP